MWFGKKNKVDYLHKFVSPCYVLNTKDNLDKFDAKKEKDIFLVILHTVRPIEFTTKLVLKLRNLYMSTLYMLTPYSKGDRVWNLGEILQQLKWISLEEKSLEERHGELSTSQQGCTNPNIVKSHQPGKITGSP